MAQAPASKSLFHGYFIYLQPETVSLYPLLPVFPLTSISFHLTSVFHCRCRPTLSTPSHRLHSSSTTTTVLNYRSACRRGFITYTPANMCYQIVERYSVCRCLYHRHSVDPCRAYGQRGHSVTEKTVLVGFACSRHSVRRSANEQSSSQSDAQSRWRDSGYSSGGGAAFHSSSGQRR